MAAAKDFTKMRETNRFRSSSRITAAASSSHVGAQVVVIQGSDCFNQIFSGNWRGMEVTYPCSGTYCLAPPVPRRPWQFTIFAEACLLARHNDLPAEFLPEGCSKIQIDGGSSGYDKVE
jgi:hypothetical protein